MKLWLYLKNGIYFTYGIMLRNTSWCWWTIHFFHHTLVNSLLSRVRVRIEITKMKNMDKKWHTRVNHFKSKPSSFISILPMYSFVLVFSFSLLFSHVLEINTDAWKKCIALSWGSGLCFLTHFINHGSYLVSLKVQEYFPERLI